MVWGDDDLLRVKKTFQLSARESFNECVYLLCIMVWV
jgi:hypothetical protein